MPIIVGSDIADSSMYTNNQSTVIMTGGDEKCIVTGVVHDGPKDFPTPTSSATSSTSQEESSSDGGSILAMDDADKSSSFYNYDNCSTPNSNDGGRALYAVQLAGYGKVLALNSEKSCDVDILYDEQKRAVDVDAFVGIDTDDEENEDFPVYTPKTKTCPAIPEGIVARMTDAYDIEANHSPSSLDDVCHPIDTLSLDSNSDPFAQRVGKKLTWRNVNMTLVGDGCVFL